MGMSLAAETDHGDGFALDEIEIAVFVIVNVECHMLSLNRECGGIISYFE
jgi:hypothetical protein